MKIRYKKYGKVSVKVELTVKMRADEAAVYKALRVCSRSSALICARKKTPKASDTPPPVEERWKRDADTHLE